MHPADTDGYFIHFYSLEELSFSTNSPGASTSRLTKETGRQR
jgi:hypothetical protein